MGKLLKVLTIFVFLFSVAAFVLGVLNFNKRELLIGRTNMLEQYVTKLAATIETEQPEFDGTPDHTEWDVDEVTDRVNDDPEMSEFWNTYSNALETSGTVFVNLGTRQNKDILATYYHMVPNPEKPGEMMIDRDMQGAPVVEGSGTMHDLLEDTLARADAQIKRLNTTRQQLITLRMQLDEVAGLLNEEKQQRRANLATITQLNKKIEELENVIVQKDNEIARLEREKAELNDQIAMLNDQIAEKDQQIQEQETQIARLKEQIDRLLASVAEDGRGPGSTITLSQLALTPGVKGKIREVNREFSFVIVELTEEAKAEVMPEGEFHPIELMVHRKGADGEDIIVTRIRLINPPSDDRLTIGENMYGWEQIPVEPGDAVIY
jgi:hypothetical protein